MTIPLTDRQRVLFDRLVQLGEWAGSNELPIRLLEVRGFGSFFRGKPRPHDVDLIFRVQRPEQTPQFKLFLRLLTEIRRRETQEFETPAEALYAAHSRQDARRLPGFEVAKFELRMFGEWLKGVSWNMLYPKTIEKQVEIEHPEYFLTRLIKRRLPNLNVVMMVSPGDDMPRPLGLRCGFTVSVWSRNAPDVRSNLEELLSEEVVARNARRELAYFEVQLPLIEAKGKLLRAEIDLLLKTQRRRKVGTSGRLWYEEWSNRRKELREARQEVEEKQRIAVQFDEQAWGQVPIEYDDGSVEEGGMRADRLRKRIKERYLENDVLEAIQQALVSYKSGVVQSELDTREYVAREMLDRGTVGQRRRVCALLSELGLPVIR